MGRVYGSVEDEDIAELDRIAETRGTSRSQLVSDATTEWLDRQRYPRVRDLTPEEVDRILDEAEAHRQEIDRLQAGDLRRLPGCIALRAASLLVCEVPVCLLDALRTCRPYRVEDRVACFGLDFAEDLLGAPFLGGIYIARVYI